MMKLDTGKIYILIMLTKISISCFDIDSKDIALYAYLDLCQTSNSISLNLLLTDAQWGRIILYYKMLALVGFKTLLLDPYGI